MYPYPKRIYIIYSYLSVLKLENCSSQREQLCIFQKNGRKNVLGDRDNKRGKCNQFYFES